MTCGQVLRYLLWISVDIVALISCTVCVQWPVKVGVISYVVAYLCNVYWTFSKEFYAYVRPDRQAEASCGACVLSVYSSVRPFVCYHTCEHNVLKTNEPVFMQISTSDPHGKGMKWSTFGISIKVAHGRFGGLAEASFSTLGLSSFSSYALFHRYCGYQCYLIHSLLWVIV